MLCLVALVMLSTTANAQMLHFFGNKIDKGLQVKNVTGRVVYAFILIDEMGCDGTMTVNSNRRFKLIEGEDYRNNENGKTTFYSSYFWKLSHHKLFVLRPGEKAPVQNAPCFGETVNYHHIGRAWHFNNEQWQWMKGQCLKVNPKCYWAQ